MQRKEWATAAAGSDFACVKRALGCCAHLAAVHDGDARAQGIRLLHAVRREEHGAAALALALDDAPDVAPCRWVDARRGLVEDDHRRLADESNADAEATAHAAAQAAGELVESIAIETDLQDDVHNKNNKTNNICASTSSANDPCLCNSGNPPSLRRAARRP